MVVLRRYCNANAGQRKLLAVIYKGNEELAVVLNLAVKLLTQFGCPQLGLIGPVARPLLLTPGISKLNQTHELVVVRELVGGNETIGVTRDYTRFHLLFTLTVGATCH